MAERSFWHVFLTRTCTSITVPFSLAHLCPRRCSSWACSWRVCLRSVALPPPLGLAGVGIQPLDLDGIHYLIGLGVVAHPAVGCRIPLGLLACWTRFWVMKFRPGCAQGKLWNYFVRSGKFGMALIYTSFPESH